MSGPTEFTLESVRQYMLAQDGRVTNHELVKYFKAWLTHPTEKVSARQCFKEYVNTLATIKQENGEKYLMLKKRFYPNFEDDAPPPQQQRQPQFQTQRSMQSEGSPSLLDEVMAGYQTQSMSRAPPQHHMQPPPPQQHYQQPHPHMQQLQQMPQQHPSYPMQMQQQQQQPRSYDQYPQPPQQRRMLPNTPQYRQPPPMGGSGMGSMPPADLGLPTASSHYSASPTHSQRSSYASLHQAGLPEPSRVPPPYRPPPYRPAPPPVVHHQSRPGDMGLPSNYGLPPGPPSMSRQSSYSSSSSVNAAAAMMLGNDPPPLPRRNGAQLNEISPPPPMQQQQQPHQHQQFYSNPNAAPPPSSRGPPPPPPKSMTSRDEEAAPPPLPSRPPPDASMRGSQTSLAPSLATSSNVSKSLSRQVSSSGSCEENKENTPSSTSSLMSTDSTDNACPSLTLLQQQAENEKISVRERTKTFNRMASQVDVSSALPVASSGSNGGPPSSRKSSTSSSAMIKRRNSRAAERRGSHTVVRDDRSDDSSSINTIDQNSKLWMVRSAQGDYHTLTKMLLEDPRLAKHRDFTSGFTALHWAAKHGNSDMVKLLAGHYQVDVNVKSHGGYTPLHLACQFGHQDVFDLFVKAYGGDAHVRDNHGKTPRQYMMAQDLNMGLSMSGDTFRQLKDRRRTRRQAAEKLQNPGILRFGSLSVKVKKTTEAFNNYFSSSDRKASLEGPAGALMAARGGMDADKMPPPRFAPIKKRKSKRSLDYGKGKSAPTTPVERSPSKEFLPEVLKSDDSDSEYGFDSNQWGASGAPS